MSHLLSSITELINNVAKANGYAPDAVTAALEAFKRKQNMSHPKGTFDKGGRFHFDEECPLCSSIRQPSRSYPFSHMQHGRTVAHIAALFAANPLHVKRVVKAFEIATCQAPKSAHQRLSLVATISKILKPV